MLSKEEIALQLTVAAIENKTITAGTSLVKAQDVYNYFNEIYKHLELEQPDSKS